MKKLVKVLAAAFVSVGGLLLAVSCAADDDATQEVLVGSLDIEGNYYFGGTASGEFGEGFSIPVVKWYKTYQSYENDYWDSANENLRRHITTTDTVTENVEFNITGIRILPDKVSYLDYEYVPTKRTNVNSYRIKVPVQVELTRTVSIVETRYTETVRYISSDSSGTDSEENLLELDRTSDWQTLRDETSDYYVGTYTSTYTVTFDKVGKNYYCDDYPIYSVDGNPEGGSFTLGICYGGLNSSDFDLDSGYYNNNYYESSYYTLFPSCSNLNFNRL